VTARFPTDRAPRPDGPDRVPARAAAVAPGGVPAPPEAGAPGAPGVDAGGPEAGFTLIEILMTVVILSISIGTLTAAVVMGFRTNARAEARADGSNLVGFTSRHFTRDVTSAVGAPVVNGGCGTDPKLDVPIGGGHSVTYGVTTAGTPARSQLVRRICSGATVESEAVIGSVSPAISASATCADTGTAPDVVTCGRVTLEVGWAGRAPFSFRLTADRRATAS